MPRAFKHQPLDDPRTSIRLLKIHPGSGDTIQCGLTQGLLGDRAYYCLSYTWAPDKPRHQILVNGGSFQVGDNLWRFLRAARSAGFAHPMWIDAICINQIDTKEKNHQVNRMREIYSGTARTFVWLGALNQAVRDFLGDMGSTADRFRLDNGERWDYGRRAAARETFHTMASSTEEYRTRMATELFSAQYWSRMWIIQEIMLSPTASIFTGPEDVDIDCLSICLDDTKERLLKANHRGGSLDLIGLQLLNWRQSKLDKAFNMNGAETGTSGFFPKLSTLFPKFSTNGCQNPVDRVFGLLSLAKNTIGFKVEYAWSPEDVFRYTLEFCMDLRTIDELLITGAHLLAALELGPPCTRSTCIIKSNTTRNKARISKRVMFAGNSSSGSIQLGDFSGPNGTASWAISSLVWCKSDLRIPERAGSSTAEDTETVYLAIRDGRSTHAFEYAVVQLESGQWVVKYARVHEYLRGAPQMGEDKVSHGRRGLWVGLPSEDVWYYDGPHYVRQRKAPVEFHDVLQCGGNDSYETSPDSQPGDMVTLLAWSAPNIAILDTVVHKGRQSRLAPSVRSFSPESEPWTPEVAATSAQRYPRLFQSVRNKLEKDIREKITELGQSPFSTARPSTVFLEYGDGNTMVVHPFSMRLDKD